MKVSWLTNSGGGGGSLELELARELLELLNTALELELKLALLLKAALELTLDELELELELESMEATLELLEDGSNSSVGIAEPELCEPASASVGGARAPPQAVSVMLRIPAKLEAFSQG